MIFPGALGDLLLALPVLRALRTRHGARRAHARTTLVVSEPLRALAEATALADDVASLDDAQAARLFAPGPLPDWLAGRPEVVSWLGARDATMQARLRAAAARVRFLRVVRGPGRRHAAEAYARAAGVRARRAELAAAARLRVPSSPRAGALLDVARPVLALHAGAGAPAKRWSPAGFAAVAHWWRARGGTVLELVGPAEDGPVLRDVPQVRDWPLPDLASLLAGADLYLGNDGGVSHLAGAVGARGVVLFGPTSPARWCPLGRGLTALTPRAGRRGPLSDETLPTGRVLRALASRSFLTTRYPGTSVRA